MSYGKKMIGIVFLGLIFLLLTIYSILNILIISDDAHYLGLLIYMGVICIIIALPEDDK